MASKHTEGPWIVGNNGVDVHGAKAEFPEICTAFSRSNAQLIAAAPDLVDQLKESNFAVIALKNFLITGQVDRSIYTVEVLQRLFENNMTVLKKARGE